MATSSVSSTECSRGTLSRHHVYCRGGCLFTCFECMVRKKSKTLKAIKTRLRYELGTKMLESLLHILQHPFYKLWFTGVYINFSYFHAVVILSMLFRTFSLAVLKNTHKLFEHEMKKNVTHINFKAISIACVFNYVHIKFCILLPKSN